MRAGALTVAAGLLPRWSEASRDPWPEAEIASPEAENLVRINVLGLFRPQQLRLTAANGSPLDIRIDSQPRRLSADQSRVAIRLRGNELEAQFGTENSLDSGAELRALPNNAPNAHAGQFWLEVPGKLTRRYIGTLEIRPHGAALQAVVTMPLETAVASVVWAESPPGAEQQALQAQAVAARSFLAARQAGHTGFDCCDTTHCQFLRSPPDAGSIAEQAARATQGLVLTWRDEAESRDRTLAAMYARSCGGRTRSLREAGIHSRGYPYYPVTCSYCSRHPELWQRSTQAAPRTELQRLAFNRIHGWGAVPSLASAVLDGEARGRGIGHGIGLCQLGAAAMARQGATFPQILAYYYPNTKLSQPGPNL